MSKKIVKKKTKKKTTRKQTVLDRIARRVKHSASKDAIEMAQENRIHFLHTWINDVVWDAGRKFCDPMFPRGTPQQGEIDRCCLDELLGRK